MIRRISAVTQVHQTSSIPGNVYRSPLIPTITSNALSRNAATLDLPHIEGTSIAQGGYLNPATAQEPVRVLGAAAAQRLGIDRIFTSERIWADNTWLYVAGILKPAVLARDIDSSVLAGFPAAEPYLGIDGHPTTIHVRSQTDQVNAVDNLLGATANPENPNEVNVSQPSAALVAQLPAKSAFNNLFLGLGAVALLDGAVGVANIMIISVLERRSETGPRRALGATKSHVRAQSLTEAILLALLGGAAGVTAGALSTTIYANSKHHAIVIPTQAWAGGIGAAVVIGAVAGLWAALRAAPLSPTQALWSV